MPVKFAPYDYYLQNISFCAYLRLDFATVWMMTGRER
jgi:hypothetical protein